MKYFSFYLLFFIVFASCKSNVSDVPSDDSDDIEVRSNSSDALVYKVFGDYTVFYSESQNKFFQIQYENKPVLTGSYEFVEYGREVLKIREVSSRDILEFSFSDEAHHNIYGLGAFAGSGYNDNLLIQTGGNTDITDDPQALSCTCKKNGTQPACEHGGVGSNACSVADGGSLGVGGKNECSVICNDGYYACCNELAIDDDGDE